MNNVESVFLPSVFYFYYTLLSLLAFDFLYSWIILCQFYAHKSLSCSRLKGSQDSSHASMHLMLYLIIASMSVQCLDASHRLKSPEKQETIFPYSFLSSPMFLVIPGNALNMFSQLEFITVAILIIHIEYLIGFQCLIIVVFSYI